MAKQLFNQFDEVLKKGTFIDVGNLRGGVITAQEIVLAGGTHGILRSQNFVSGSSGWAVFGDGNAEFNDIIVRGDIESGNWDGTSPANLVSVDTGATAGFYLDASAGAAQFATLFVGRPGTDGVWVEFDPANQSANPISFVGSDGGSTDFGGFTGSTFMGFFILSSSPNQPSYTHGLNIDAQDTVNNSNVVLHASNTDGATYLWIENKQILLWDNSAGSGVDGSAAVPVLSFWNDRDTGMYRRGTNQIGFGLGGSEQLALISNQAVFRAGTAGAPSITFTGDIDTGFYSSTGDLIGFAAGGAAQMTVSPAAGTGVRSVAVRDTTTGAAASVFINATNGLFARSTSALKYKNRITKNVDYLADIVLTPTKHYRKDDKQWRYGLIANWLAEQDPLLGTYDEDGEIESYDDRAVLTVMAAKINRLEAALKELVS